MKINDIVANYFRKSDRSGWFAKEDVKCRICNSTLIKGNSRFSKNKLHKKHYTRTGRGKYQYLLFCGEQCKSLFNLNPLPYEDNSLYVDEL